MINPSDSRLIRAIAERAAQMYEHYGVPVKPQFIESELRLVHEDVVPLRLQELLEADRFNFAHDIGGIHRHLVIDRPCRLSGCFLPRFAVS